MFNCGVSSSGRKTMSGASPVVFGSRFSNRRIYEIKVSSIQDNSCRIDLEIPLHFYLRGIYQRARSIPIYFYDYWKKYPREFQICLLFNVGFLQCCQSWPALIHEYLVAQLVLATCLHDNTHSHCSIVPTAMTRQKPTFLIQYV